MAGWAILAFGVILVGSSVLQSFMESEDVDRPPVAYAILAGLTGVASWYELMGTER